MLPFYRMIELAVFSLLNFFPFMLLALYPFRDDLRFSKRITIILIAALTLFQLILGSWAFLAPERKVGIVSAMSTLIYAVFYFVSVKKHFGKTFFTLLMISNMVNFAVVSAKCMEGLLFPELALQEYRWSFSLMLLAVEAVVIYPAFLYMKKVITPAVKREPSGFEWKYLWLIPATFYVIWYYAFYGNISRTGLEIALRPKNTIFLLVVNIGALLIYYVVARLVSEQGRSLELTERNHQLAMQAVQYENLQEKITEARRAKHDVRHHIALMQEYLNEGKLDDLREYLGKYNESLPDDSLIRFCENTAANTVLLYFAQQAKNNGIDYIVKADIPEKAPIDDADISVLFGNLLENALDACNAESAADKKIIVRASLSGGTFCVTADNTFTGTLKYNQSGNLDSTKHRGEGLGTRSVKSIVERYGGICRFEVRDGMFCASVSCFDCEKE